MKTLTIRQFAAIKRVAQNVNPLVVKKNKIVSKIMELNEEYNAINKEIEGHEMGVKALTGGLISEYLITKRIEDTNKTDKDGKPIKVTKYEPKEGVVTFNTEANVYEINIDADLTFNGVESATVDNKQVAPEIEVKAGEESPIDPMGFFDN